MDGELNRRKFTLAGLASMFLPSGGHAQQGPESQALSIDAISMRPQDVAEAVEATADSLSRGMDVFQGLRTNPRASGFRYHPDLLEHYGKRFQNARGQELLALLRERLLNRVKIFPISSTDMDKLQSDGKESNFTASRIKSFARSVDVNENAGIIYISADRQFQRMYSARKTSPSTLTFLESYPISTSRKEPKDPKIETDSGITPLGEFIIPSGGVLLALLGEVTKVERADLTRHYFLPISIDAITKYFVRDFDRASEGEILTVTGDTHLVWSREINGAGIKIHDTTEVQNIGTSASSGCIRTPSVRRFSSMVSQNRKPTKILILWAKEGANDRNEGGFGGYFGGEPISPARPGTKK